MRNSCVLSLTVVLVLAVLLSVLSCVGVLASGQGVEDRGKNLEAAGALVAQSQTGERIQFPLKQTSVKAEISGSISRVTVEQRFENPFADKIEAVYLFPLPQSAAVDGMTITVGGRRIKGVIMKRQEAKATYEAAKNSGRAAALLDQLRPNV